MGAATDMVNGTQTRDFNGLVYEMSATGMELLLECLNGVPGGYVYD